MKLNAQEAMAADNVFSSIRETGKYVGTITRAEKIVSKNGTQGLGLSFKSNDGATADYLDLWYQGADGNKLPSNKQVMALLACLKLREPVDGEVTFDAWDKTTKSKVKKTTMGYPEMMGKPIGFLLQQELGEHEGKTTDKIVIFGVFQADTELTATEILKQKTSPEQLAKMLGSLMQRPVRDTRRNKTASTAFSDGRPVPQSTDSADDLPW